MSIRLVLTFHLTLFHLLAFDFTPSPFSFYISNAETGGNVPPSLRKYFYLWSIAFHSAASCIGPRNEWQFNALLYTLMPVIFGVIVSKWFWQTLPACVKMRRDSLTLIYATLSLTHMFSVLAFDAIFNFLVFFFYPQSKKTNKNSSICVFSRKKRTENSVDKDNKSV